MNGKTPKGTIDLYGENFSIFSQYKNSLEKLFIEYGGNGLDTPVFEIRENLIGAGDECCNKLIYNLEDDGSKMSEQYSLRYDLTVPKSRFIRSNNIKKDKIYSIGKVYRRDNPSKGRYREFYQADFDIVDVDQGSVEEGEDIMNEFMLLKMASEFLSEKGVTDYTILINDTKYPYYLLIDVLNIKPESFKSVCSTIDKLDKTDFKSLREEFGQKGLTDKQMDEFEQLLISDVSLSDEMDRKIKLFIDYADCIQSPFGDKIKFCPYLARGLDYYNGLIFEIKLNTGNASTIISGGRYDGFVPGRRMVGISFGITRMMDLIEQKKEESEWKDIYYLTSLDDVDMKTKLSILSVCEKIFSKKINTSFSVKKLVKTINYCISNKIRYLIILSENEIKMGYIILKDLKLNTQVNVSLDI